MRSHGERGQVLVLFALVMSLVLVVLVFGIADLSYEDVAWSQVSQDTFLGARSGASDLNQSLLINGGGFALSVSQAEGLCRSYVAANVSRIPGFSGQPAPSCIAFQQGGNWFVKASITVHLKLPFPSFVPNKVSSSSVAELQHGVCSTNLSAPCP